MLKAHAPQTMVSESFSRTDFFSFGLELLISRMRIQIEVLKAGYSNTHLNFQHLEC